MINFILHIFERAAYGRSSLDEFRERAEKKRKDEERQAMGSQQFFNRNPRFEAPIFDITGEGLSEALKDILDTGR